MKFHLKKRHLRDDCPVCGAVEYKMKKPTINEAFKATYTGWQKVMTKRRPGWNIPCWSAHCSDCIWKKVMTEISPFWERVRKHKQFEGTTYTFPMRYTK